jgi:hypothetical protein
MARQKHLLVIDTKTAQVVGKILCEDIDARFGLDVFLEEYLKHLEGEPLSEQLKEDYEYWQEQAPLMFDCFPHITFAREEPKPRYGYAKTPLKH